MTIYYTAKDIEEMAAQGIRQIEIGPGITLTDFARETARQLEIALVKSGSESAQAGTAAMGRTSRYNKPSGCMHGAQPGQQAPGRQTGGGSADTVNRLIDLVGSAVKRGG